MKQLFFILAFCYLAALVNAQSLKNNIVLATEVSMNITADPEKRKSGYEKGFMIDFKVSFGLNKVSPTTYLIQVDEIKPRAAKGFFYKISFNKPGQYYSCSELAGACNNIVLDDAWIAAIWEYQGKQYKTGAIQLNTQKGNFLNYTTGIYGPGAIPVQAIKSGEAKVIGVEFVSWTVKNEQAIIDLLQNKYK